MGTGWVDLEGQGDLLGGLIMGVIRVAIWILGLVTYLLSPPDPPSRVSGSRGHSKIFCWDSRIGRLT